MTTNQKIYSYLLKLLSVKDYSEAELKSKVFKKYNIDSGAIELILADLKSKGFIDDERLAKNIISYKLDSLYGPNKLYEILKRKGLLKYQSLIEEYFEEKVDILKPALVSKVFKKYEILRRKKDLKVYEKLLRYLLSRGYDYGFSKEIVKEVLNDESNLS